MEDKKKKRYHYQYSLTINNNEKEIKLWSDFNNTAEKMFMSQKSAILLALSLYVDKFGDGGDS